MLVNMICLGCNLSGYTVVNGLKQTRRCYNPDCLIYDIEFKISRDCPPSVPVQYTTSQYWQPEFFHIDKVLEMGAKKHGANNWLDPDGSKSSHKQMCDSAFHHLAAEFCDPGGNDKESGLPHVLHAACRLLMCYTRRVRGLSHKDEGKV